MALDFTNGGFGDALVVLGAAGVVIPAFARFRITPVIGFILVGVLVGPAGLGALAGQYPWLEHVTINDRAAIEPFAEFGIILLLFSIGLDLSMRRLWALRRLVFGIGAAQLIGIGAVLGLSLMAIGGYGAGAAFGLGIALALSSTAIVLPIVGTKSPVGQSAFSILLFEDLAIVPIIFALGALAPHVQDDALSGLFTTIWQGLLVVGALALAGWFLLPRIFAQAARAKNPELFMAASLLVVIVAALATAAVGLSPIVGALVAGLVIAETEYHGEVEAITAPFKGLALGVFLITVGMSIDLRAVMAQAPELAAAVGGVLLIKAVITAALLRFNGAHRATAIETGVLMASPSETTLIVLAAALEAGIIAQSTAQFWQMVTAIGLTITPILARVGHDVARRIEMRVAMPGLAAFDTDERPHTIIFGFGRVGRIVADLLGEHGRHYVAVEADIDAVIAARRGGYEVLLGDVARAATVERLRLDLAEAVVLTMNDPVQQVHLTRKLRALYPALPLITRARDADHAAELYRAGATDAVPETLESSLQLSEAVLTDLGVAMGPVIASIHDVRARMRRDIMDKGALDHEPRLRRTQQSPHA
ncbi:MAG: hypothetical protein RLZZ58_1515 [Pseudomonadota bacterium]